MEEKKNGHGGARVGAGRPLKGYSDARKQRQIRAHDHEWELIREFNKLLKVDFERAKELLEQLK